MNDLVAADFHINASRRPLDTVRVMRFIMDYAIEHKVFRIIVVGDIYHKRYPRPDEQFIFHKWIMKGLSNGIKFLIVKGNHDIFESKFLETPYYSFGELDTLGFQDSVKVVDSEYIENGIYYGHIPLNDAKVGASCVTIPTSLSSSQLEASHPNCRLLLLGDIHKQQKLKTKTYYVGSPERVDFNERDDSKVFLHLTDGSVGRAPKNRDLVRDSEVVGTGDKQLALYWIKTPATKMFDVVEDHVSKQVFESEIPEEDLRDAIIKVTLKIEQELAWVIDIQEVYKRYALAREIKSVELDIVDGREAVRNEKIKDSNSPVDCFKEYCGEQRYSKDVIEVGVKILQECS